MIAEPFRYLDFDPRKLPKDYLEAIGLVMACSGQTEDHVQMAIAGLLGIDGETGWALTTHMTAPLRDSVARSLIELRTDNATILREFETILDNIKKAWDLRSTYAHGLWCIDEKTGEVQMVKTTSRTGLTVDVRPVKLEEIKAAADTIYQAGIDLMAFLLMYQLAPNLPPRDRERAHMNKTSRKQRRKG